MKKYRLSNKVIEQAERMSEKWKYRALSYLDNWERDLGYCKSEEEAMKCYREYEKIVELLGNVSGYWGDLRADWSTIEQLKKAARDRDILDSQI